MHQNRKSSETIFSYIYAKHSLVAFSTLLHCHSIFAIYFVYTFAISTWDLEVLSDQKIVARAKRLKTVLE